MTDIFPAEDQSVGEVITELAGLGLVDGTDFRLHYTWDMRPYLKTEPDAYKKWEAKHGGGDDSDQDEKSTSDDDEKSTSDSGKDDDGKGSSTARKRGGK